jgi:hypothetical protein
MTIIHLDLPVLLICELRSEIPVLGYELAEERITKYFIQQATMVPTV